MHIVTMKRCQADLTQLILTLRSSGRFTTRLNRGQQQRGKSSDNCDDYQKFNERKASLRSCSDTHGPVPDKHIARHPNNSLRKTNNELKLPTAAFGDR